MDKRELQNFDRFAGEYENVLNQSLEYVGKDGEYFAKYKISRLKAMCSRRGTIPTSILEFGCGTGKNLKYLRDAFPEASLCGTDISKESLDIAERLQLERCRIDLFDGQTLPYEAGTFDLILAANVFHHIPFDLHPDLVARLRNTLRPHGTLVLFEHNPLNPLTRKIVRECPFDKDARLLAPGYAKRLLRDGFASKPVVHYVLFVPPILKHWLFLEKYLEWLPLGAQYAAFSGSGGPAVR
jgi:SAM-dependent methyltransferase